MGQWEISIYAELTTQNWLHANCLVKLLNLNSDSPSVIVFCTLNHWSSWTLRSPFISDFVKSPSHPSNFVNDLFNHRYVCQKKLFAHYSCHTSIICTTSRVSAESEVSCLG
jgi:hypothetical protein